MPLGVLDPVLLVKYFISTMFIFAPSCSGKSFLAQRIPALTDGDYIPQYPGLIRWWKERDRRLNLRDGLYHLQALSPYQDSSTILFAPNVDALKAFHLLPRYRTIFWIPPIESVTRNREARRKALLADTEIYLSILLKSPVTIGDEEGDLDKRRVILSMEQVTELRARMRTRSPDVNVATGFVIRNPDVYANDCLSFNVRGMGVDAYLGDYVKWVDSTLTCPGILLLSSLQPLGDDIFTHRQELLDFARSIPSNRISEYSSDEIVSNYLASPNKDPSFWFLAGNAPISGGESS